MMGAGACVAIASGLAIVMTLLWIPVALRWKLPDPAALVFLFGGFTLPVVGCLLCAIVLLRAQRARAGVLVALAANAALLLLHLSLVRGFYTA